ncbi:aldo/keto reductase [Actinospongicola halichondriae]|uniref:aldo/keto reductase n=1 Tax=Actinospongicola halichondriae TaxID=3236844 RepID=UPI003D426D35
MESLVDGGPRTIVGVDRPVGPLAFGCWRFTHGDVGHARQVLEAAIDAGMVLVDTADVYGLDWGGAGFGANESLLGRVLREAPHLRDRIVVATKGGIAPPVPYDSSPAGLRGACEASLRRLGVETIDLYQVHRPDLFVHPSALADTLLMLRDEGKIAAIGVSNHTASQHAALEAHLGEPLATSQPEFSVQELAPVRDGVFDHCMRTGTQPLAWSPLAGGALATGVGARPDVVTVLDRIAERESVGRADVALAFVLAHPSRPIAVVGSQDPARLATATTATSVHLDRTDLYELVVASEGRPLP